MKVRRDARAELVGPVAEALVPQISPQRVELHEEHVLSAGRGERRAAAEIKDRVEELKKQRAALTDGIPAEALSMLEALIKLRGDEAMCSVEVLDRRNHEYSCSGCMMTLPVETVSAMLSGKLTKCVSCHCIVYTEEDLLTPPPSTKSGGKSKQVAKA